MPPPIGSKTISNINFDKLYYLTSATNNSSVCNDESFNMTTGKPLNNLTINPLVDSFFLDNLKIILAENKNIYDTDFISKYPKVLETDTLRDIEISAGGETMIHAVFIHEGASMKNMFGYYFYYINEEGQKVLLDNAEGETAYYYRPTVILPHVFSEDDNLSSLKLGEQRKLRGNLPNGNFSNIYVGFFLVIHGWLAKTGNGLCADDQFLYSTVDFAHQYSETQWEIVNNRIFSIYAKAENSDGDQMLFTAFEDLVDKQNQNDMDYNDCVVGFNISDVSTVVGYDDYSKVYVPTTPIAPSSNTIVNIDDEGEYAEFKKTAYTFVYGKNYIFERHIFFPNEEDRNSFKTVYNRLFTNYKHESIVNVGDKGLKISYLFRKNDITNNTTGDKVKLYLFQAKFNKSKSGDVTDYDELFNKIYKDSDYYERYALYRHDDDDESSLISTSTVFDKPNVLSSNKNTGFLVTGSGLVECQNGRSRLPFTTSQIYKIYKNSSSGNKGLVINVGMDTHPTGYKAGTKTFLRYVSFNVDNSELVVVDLKDLSLYNGELSSITPSFTKITVSSVTANSNYIKNLINVFRNDSGATYRVVQIGQLKFYCIRFPNIKNNPTMVYLANGFNVSLSQRSNTLLGTYFYNRTFYPVDGYTVW